MPTHHIIIISCVVWFISHQTSRPLIKHTPADRMKPIGIINILIFEFVEISWYEFWSYGRCVKASKTLYLTYLNESKSL